MSPYAKSALTFLAVAGAVALFFVVRWDLAAAVTAATGIG